MQGGYRQPARGPGSVDSDFPPRITLTVQTLRASTHRSPSLRFTKWRATVVDIFVQHGDAKERRGGAIQRTTRERSKRCRLLLRCCSLEGRFRVL